MNLQEFLSYRECCPICNNKLVTSFHSQKRQAIKFEDGRLVVIFRLDAIKKHQIDYKVGYSFSLEDNTWYAEFYNQDEKRFEVDSPSFLRDRFKELDKNLGGYKFYRHCGWCKRYNYSTNSFDLNFKTGGIDKLCMCMEYIGLSTPIEKGFKIYRMLNDYMSNRTTLLYGKQSDEDSTKYDASVGPKFLDILETSAIIKFSSPQETAERIDKLIVFS